jgi:hypothetical protein
MNVTTVLNNTLSLATLKMHRIRFQAFFACVHNVLQERNLIYCPELVNHYIELF